MSADKDVRFAPAWLPDSKNLLLTEREKDGGERIYMQSIGSAAPRAITPEGYGSAVIHAFSPDGKSFIARRTSDRACVLLPIAGAPSRPITGALADDLPLRWTPDGRAIYVFQSGSSSVPGKIFRLELATGKRALVKELAPEDRAGAVGVNHAAISEDGKTIVFSHPRGISNLYLVMVH